MSKPQSECSRTPPHLTCTSSVWFPFPSSPLLSPPICHLLSTVGFPLHLSPFGYLLHSHRQTPQAAHTHTPAYTRAWLTSVSLPCFRKVSEQGRPSERHFSPNYVDLKTSMDTRGGRRWEGEGGVGALDSFMNIHYQTLKTYPLMGHHRGKTSQSTPFEMFSLCRHSSSQSSLSVLSAWML